MNVWRWKFEKLRNWKFLIFINESLQMNGNERLEFRALGGNVSSALLRTGQCINLIPIKLVLIVGFEYIYYNFSKYSLNIIILSDRR